MGLFRWVLSKIEEREKRITAKENDEAFELNCGLEIAIARKEHEREKNNQVITKEDIREILRNHYSKNK